MQTQKKRIEECFADTLAECASHELPPHEVAEALFDALDGWIKYYSIELNQYTGIVDELRKRICKA
jgi:hypothetical protein